MSVIDDIWAKIKDLEKKVVYPEATDVRVLEAAVKVTEISKIKPVLVGDKEQILEVAQNANIDISDVEIVENQKSDKLETYAQSFYEKRKHKGVSIDDARHVMADPLNFATQMLNHDEVDGCVAGCVNSTGNVIRAGLFNVGTASGIKTISSCFMMLIPDKSFGENGVLMYSDAGVVPDPTPAQLCDIAKSTAHTFTKLVGAEPKIALLSFSTKGSASHPMVDKMTDALKIIKADAPELNVDGELQADAAIIPSVAEKKIKGDKSLVAGQANILIFPDLNCGNISYKLTERLAKASAFGPLLQGLAKPINDLSRGCSADDIVNVTAITIAQSL